MTLFSDILQKLAASITEKGAEKEQIAKIMSDVLTIPITADMVTYKNTKVYITASPTIKLALKLKESELLRLFSSHNISVSSIG